MCDPRPTCHCAEELSDESCRSTAESIFSQYVALPDDTALDYDAACGATVVAAYEALGCGTEADLAFDLSRGGVAECGRCKLYYGTKQVGEPCATLDEADYDDCAQGLFCFVEGDDPTAEGSCGDPCEAAGLGESCASRPCDEGLVCPTALGSTICQLAVGEGEPCDSGTCGEGLVCATLSGICVRTPGVGDPCDGDCADGSYCAKEDTAAFTCHATKHEGDACLVDGECDSHHCDLEANVCRVAPPLVCSQRF